MSAIADDRDGSFEPVKVMIALHAGMDTMDVMLPLEVFSNALHNQSDKTSKAFQVIFVGADEHTVTAEGASLRAHIDYNEAMKRVREIDVLVIPGGGDDPTLKNKEQPMALIKAYADLQKKNPNRERTLMSVSTASLALGEAGLLSGLAATTHPDFVTKLEIVCSNAAQRDLVDRTDVMESARYVVNNLRFELGENEDENPYILNRKELKEHKRRKSSAGKLPSPIEEQPNGSGRRPSAARKGSMSLKQSNARRESMMKRANLRLGGLRVLTTGGSASGFDGALYLVGALVSEESADEIVRQKGWKWQKGVVVDGIDV